MVCYFVVGGRSLCIIMVLFGVKFIVVIIDLFGFWVGSYGDVCKDMCGCYLCYLWLENLFEVDFIICVKLCGI